LLVCCCLIVCGRIRHVSTFIKRFSMSFSLSNMSLWFCTIRCWLLSISSSWCWTFSIMPVCALGDWKSWAKIKKKNEFLAFTYIFY
jgi:hypothetical protein